VQITRLRLLGFKSFVEPTELLIERGLTGVVGPNGCGKSNLLEALRWAMGETSYKSMRGAAMEDVIFRRPEDRPARNSAEVHPCSSTIAGARRRPSSTTATRWKWTRRIERERARPYKVNGKDARARDVRLLSRMRATGARSPALVRQGRIARSSIPRRRNAAACSKMPRGLPLA
jgi:chromosome segregation protein